MIDPVPMLLPLIRGGSKVFPIASGAKKPPLILDFPNNASDDEAQIREWAAKYPGCNWGLSLTASNVWCLDLDGTQGAQWRAEQERIRGDSWTHTRQCKTANGGTHLYFRMPNPEVHSSTSEIAPKVDVKGHNSYCLIPPSVVSGSPYSWLGPATLGAPNAADWLLAQVRAASEKKSQPENNSNGNGSPRVIPAGTRNSTLASIAGTLRRRALSEGAIVAALTVTNQEACKPPLAAEEVKEIASSIACYKPESRLIARPVKAKPAPALEESRARITSVEQIPDIRSLPSTPVRWLVDDLLPQNQVTILAGEFSSGKTYLAMLLAAALVRGNRFLGRDTMRQKIVLYLDKENPAAVIRERIENIYEEGEESHKHWGAWLPDEVPTFADERLLAWAEQGAVLIFDSLIRFHDANENDPSEMSKVLGLCRKLQARGASVVVLHHRPKNLEAGYRGSSEIAAGADLVLTLGKTRETGVLQLETIKDRLGIAPRLSFRANWGEGSIEPVEPGETAAKRMLIAKIREVIERSPGTRQSEIVAELKGTASRNSIQRALAQREGDLWRVEGGGKGAAKVYFPKLLRTKR